MNDQMKMKSKQKSHLLPSVALLQLLLTALLVLAASTGGTFNLTVNDTVTHQSLPIFSTTNGANIINYLVINSTMTNMLDFQIAPTNSVTHQSETLDSIKWDFGDAIEPPASPPLTGTSVLVTLNTNNFPTNLAPVTIHVQRTDESGATCKSTQKVVMLLPAGLAVDSNRDGTIAMANSNPTGAPVDTTSQTEPFRFWVNDGQNVAEDKASVYGTTDVTTPNWKLGQINFKGDLENFSRLWIFTGGLQSAIKSGAIKVALQWQNVTAGSPAINVYQAFSTDGGTEYLNNDTTAGNQIAGAYGTAVAKVTGTSPVVLPASLFTNLSSTNSLTYCLFEGAGAGAGELVMVFENSSGTVIGQGGQVYMSLKTVTDMYKQAQVSPPGPTDIADPYTFPGTGNWSSTTSVNDSHGPPSYAAGTSPTVGWTDTTSSNFEHPADETKNCILFVHGWNVTDQRYLQQSIECFKRLWLQGYKGLYAAIRWPGDVTGSDTGGTTVTAANATDYFEIEYRAFKYSGSVKQYTASLTGQGYSVGVLAHSMGNIVSSEALHQGASFEYVMMDAAVSSRCYDTSASLEFSGTTFNPPDLYTSGGYGGYFSGLSGVVNCWNKLDNALIHSWQAANEIAKGQTDVANTSYVFTGGTGVQLQYVLSPTHPQYFYRDVFANSVTNYHESMTMYAVTRTPAVGSQSVSGAVSDDVDMQTYFPGSSAHSPQFDLDVSDSSGGAMLFYQQVLTDLNFQ